MKVERQSCPEPASEGSYVNHVFEIGSSGLFGEETPGPWMSEKLALLKYRLIFAKYRLVGNYGVFPNLHEKINCPAVHPGWYDTHAKR